MEKRKTICSEQFPSLDYYGRGKKQQTQNKLGHVVLCT